MAMSRALFSPSLTNALQPVAGASALVRNRHNEDLTRFDGVKQREWKARDESLSYRAAYDRASFGQGQDSFRRLFHRLQKIPAEPLSS